LFRLKSVGIAADRLSIPHTNWQDKWQDKNIDIHTDYHAIWQDK
jgi:hypothetical protein